MIKLMDEKNIWIQITNVNVGSMPKRKCRVNVKNHNNVKEFKIEKYSKIRR